MGSSVVVDGLRAYERRGVGPPVVFVHGYVGDGPSTWRPQLDGLADDFDVIALDLPGAGGSEDPPENFGMVGFASVIAGSLASLDLDAPHLVGLSFGGATLIEFCRRYQEAAATMTLVGAYAEWAGSLAPEEVDGRLHQALDLSQLAPGQLLEGLMPTMFAAGAPPEVVAEYERSLAAFHPSGLRAMARACTEDLTEVLETIRLPTLLHLRRERHTSPRRRRRRPAPCDLWLDTGDVARCRPRVQHRRGGRLQRCPPSVPPRAPAELTCS